MTNSISEAVEAAYREGYADSVLKHFRTVDRNWHDSKAREALSVDCITLGSEAVERASVAIFQALHPKGDWKQYGNQRRYRKAADAALTAMKGNRDA